MTNIGLMLLAAGGSRRLGTPKQLLRDASGLSLVRHAAQTALQTPCRPVVVVLGAFAETVQAELADLPLAFIVNQDWQSGMASSIRCGLHALTAHAAPDAVLVMLCDQPQVTPALLQSLVNAFQQHNTFLATCTYNGIAGVPALFGSSLFNALAALDGEQGARHVIRTCREPFPCVPFADGALDVDTPADARFWAGRTLLDA